MGELAGLGRNEVSVGSDLDQALARCDVLIDFSTPAATARHARAAPAAGKALANNCSACHGETGLTSNPAWPSIAGQQPAYLVNVLKAFRAGLRMDPMMAAVARSLSDADIANLAAYYAAQRCGPATP